MGRRCVLVLSKPSYPGRVKTRLIGEVSADQAAELHRAFLSDTAARLSKGAFSLWLSWALDGGECMPETPLADHAIRQQGKDLGARIHHAMSLAAESHEHLAAVGSDSPHLPVELVEKAFRALEQGADVVIGPATDGGFYLIALGRRALRAEIFEDIPWSSGQECEAVMGRCGESGLVVTEIDPMVDIDEVQDLDFLTSLLAEGSVDCPATAEVLRKWGRLQL